MPLELTSTGRGPPKPEALEVKSGTWASSGLVSIGRCLPWEQRKESKAVVQKGSAVTQEYESCQQNDMEVDKDEGMVELSFIPSAVSGSAAWREPLRAKNMCEKKCNKEGLKFHDIAAILVEDDAKPPSMNLCLNCYNLRLAEWNGSEGPGCHCQVESHDR